MVWLVESGKGGVMRALGRILAACEETPVTRREVRLKGETRERDETMQLAGAKLENVDDA